MKMSKYEPLWNYLHKQKESLIQLTYKEIEKILGFDVDHSFLTYKKDLITYGYEVIKISIKEKTITFQKVNRKV